MDRNRHGISSRRQLALVRLEVGGVAGRQRLVVTGIKRKRREGATGIPVSHRRLLRGIETRVQFGWPWACDQCASSVWLINGPREGYENCTEQYNCTCHTE